MLKGLFKSGWKSDSVEKRLRFITDIDVLASANQTILQKLAANDVEPSVRHAAMSKISDPQALFNLSQTDVSNQSESREFAETAFRNLIQSGCNFTEADFKAFMVNNPKSQIILAKYCPDAAIRDEILISLDEPEKAEIISDIPYSKTRVMLAESISSIASLEVARKNLKGKDKSAEKIIKAKIDAFHAEQKLELENTTLAISIREQMESLARYVNWSDEIKVKFFKLTKTWDTLGFTPSSEESELYQQAFATVEADVKHNMAITLSQQSQETIVNSLETLCEKIATYPLDTMLSESKEVSDKLSDLSWQLSKEAETIPHTVNVHERFNLVSGAIKSAISISKSVKESRALTIDDDTDDINPSNEVNTKAKAILQATKGSAWPNKYPTLLSANEAILEANTLLSVSNDARKQAKESLDNLHKRINRIFGSTKRGDVGRAQRELASVLKASNHYEGSDRKKLDERIEELTDEVNKMGDWKDFAIEPKLVELCEQMEVLPELERQSKNPSADKLAKKIKTLQETWKTMGSSDISDTYWPRFKEAGDKAYEPCAEFFKQRRAIQQENLEKREPLVSKMKDLFEATDWNAKPDFKAIEDNISQIMQSWKKIKDVEHGRGQKQWEKLAKIKDQINEKLDIEYDKNITAKHALTTQFEQMLEEDVSDQSLDKLKFIQSKWKQVGVTRRKQDQDAWLKFKAASDAVYEKIQGLRNAKRAVEDEQIGAYKKIHSQIHQLAKSTQDLTVSDKEYEALKEQYNALPALPTSLPEKLIERLDNDYAKASDAYAGAKDRLNKEKLDNEFETLVAKAQLCAELEQLPESTEQSFIDELQDKISSLEMSNKEYIKRFSKRFKKARDTSRDDYASARRLLLINCEILIGIDSPKEDKDLRLQIQLDRMKQQGFGNAPIDISATMNNNKLEWLCMPGAEAKLQKQFDERFNKLIK